MTIQECIDRVDALKANSMPLSEKMKYLSQIEGYIHSEIVMTHEHTPAEETCPVYTEETDPDTELIVPAPHDLVYVYWLWSRIDFMNLEMDKFNNSKALFESEYGTLADWWNRTKMPIQKNRELRI